jgi:hypothetical protein
MSNGYILEEVANERLAKQAIASANAALDATREIRAEVGELRQLIAAMVMSNGGTLYVDEMLLHSAKHAELKSHKDEDNRRWVFRVDSSR